MTHSARTIVLTGVTKGLGRAMALGFAKLGHRIMGCGRNQAELDSLAQILGKQHQLVQVDICHSAETSSWAKSLWEQGIVPDLLINNAAVINKPAPSWRIPAEEWARILQINVVGTAAILQAFLPAMVEVKKGVIVNFSSLWGRSTSADVGPYCASKYAIEGLNGSLSQELPQEMATVALNPGIIHTQMLETCFGDGANAYPSPTTWAEKAVPFILKLDSKNNGQSLSVS